MFGIREHKYLRQADIPADDRKGIDRKAVRDLVRRRRLWWLVIGLLVVASVRSNYFYVGDLYNLRAEFIGDLVDMLLIVMAAVIMLGAGRNCLRSAMEDYGFCLECGYVARGITSARCPECGSLSRGRPTPLLVVHDADRHGDYVLKDGRHSFSPNKNGWAVLYSGPGSPPADARSTAGVVAGLCASAGTGTVVAVTEPRPYKHETAPALPDGWVLVRTERSGWQMYTPCFNEAAFADYYDRLSSHESWMFLICPDGTAEEALRGELSFREILRHERLRWIHFVLADNEHMDLLCLLARAMSDTGVAVEGLIRAGLAGR